MNTIIHLLRKEFLQIFRNKIIVAMLFVMPIVQMLLLGFAADFEIKNISVHIIDQDMSAASRRLVGKFQASTYFKVVNSSFATKLAVEDLERNEADLFLQIPPHFEKDLLKNQTATLQLTLNAVDGQKAGIGNGYANAIIQDFNQNIRTEWLNVPKMAGTPQGIDIVYANWFNPSLQYSDFMVPGILTMLVTMVGMVLCSFNIVKEKEIGTIEQINVTPIHKSQFIIGKLFPFWVIGLVALAIGLTFAKLIFDIPMVGSLVLVFAFAAVFLLVVLGMGLLISTISDTQQQALFICWFFLLIFILMSGLFTPIESMPLWAQKIAMFNPIGYFIEVMRLVLLKGSNFYDVQEHFLKMGIFAVVMNSLAILNYRKTS